MNIPTDDRFGLGDKCQLFLLGQEVIGEVDGLENSRKMAVDKLFRQVGDKLLTSGDNNKTESAGLQKLFVIIQRRDDWLSGVDF
jgi:hypothetical protein